MNWSRPTSWFGVFRKRPDAPPRINCPVENVKEEAHSVAPDSIICLVANVREETPFGENELRKGAKGLRRGKKVYCFPPLWGDGYEQIKVMTQLKSSYFTKIYHRKYFLNWRKERAYKPWIIREMGSGWDERKLDGTINYLRNFTKAVDAEVEKRKKAINGN